MSERILPVIFSLSSTALTNQEKEFFLDNPCSGFILFSRNITSKEQVKQLNNSLCALYPDRDIKILVDQEGGRVARLKPPIAQKLYPNAEYFADLYKDNKAEALNATLENYKEIMLEAKNLGYDSICAPVCDLRMEGADDVIGDRSFGKDSAQVIDLSVAAINGILTAGGVPIIKHIPGHGRATVDSHYDLPYVDTSLAILEKTDFAVFKALAGMPVWAMTAHIIFKELDDKNPVTISEKAIRYLRQEIGFKGAIISDDLGMLALHGKVGKIKSFIAKLKSAIKKGDDWQTNFLENIALYFQESLDSLNKDQILALCEKKEEEMQEEFLQSLSLVSKLSIEAGCDYILHCSGKLEEMQAVIKKLD